MGFIIDGDKLLSYEDDGVEDVVIPDGVKIIDEGAFSDNKSIKSVKIPDSVSIIGRWAFARCKKLERVNIPKNVTILEHATFEGCRSLVNIELHDGIQKIEQSAFESCSSLRSIDIPDGVEVISQATFYFCTALEHIKLPENLKRIECVAFDYCKSLKEIHLPDKVEYIGSAFTNCQNLERINIPYGVEYIGDSAFRFCRIAEFDIPRTVKYIGSNAFACTPWLENKLQQNPLVIVNNIIVAADKKKLSGHLVIPDGTEKISGEAFSGSNITGVTIPESITYIGERSFAACKSLENIDFPKSIQHIDSKAFCWGTPWLEKQFSKNTLVIVNDILVDVNHDTAVNITIPTSIREISNGVFVWCKKLKTVTIQGEKSNIRFGFDKIYFNGIVEFFNADKSGKKELFKNTHMSYVYPFALFLMLEYGDIDAIKFICKNREKTLMYIINVNDVETLLKLTEVKFIPSEAIDFAIECAQFKKSAEITAILLNYKNDNFGTEPNMDKYLL